MHLWFHRAQLKKVWKEVRDMGAGSPTREEYNERTGHKEWVKDYGRDTQWVRDQSTGQEFWR